MKLKEKEESRKKFRKGIDRRDQKEENLEIKFIRGNFISK